MPALDISINRKEPPYGTISIVILSTAWSNAPQKPSPRQRFARLPLFGKLSIGCGVLLILLCVCFSGLAVYGSTLPKPAGTTPTPGQPIVQTGHTPTARPSPTPTTSQPTPTPTQTPTPTLPPTPKPIYPPKTRADLRALAALGDANAVHEFHSETVGLASCPQPKREVTVDPSITGQQLAEDLLAYFYAQGLDSPCGSVVFAYHSTSEADNFYTAGRILVQTQNNDPNNTNAQRTMTLDLGGAITSEQEYIITY